MLNKTNTAAELRFDVIPGRSYRLDASSDLLTWSQLAILSSATNSATYADTNPPAGKRFYKAVLLP